MAERVPENGGVRFPTGPPAPAWPTATTSPGPHGCGRVAVAGGTAAPVEAEGDDTPVAVLVRWRRPADPVGYDEHVRLRHRARGGDGRRLRLGRPDPPADRPGARHARPGQRPQPEGAVRRLRRPRRPAALAAGGLRGRPA